MHILDLLRVIREVMAASESLKYGLSSSLTATDEQTNDQQLCNICIVQSSKYICPRCNVRYCSLSCYQSQRHAQCSEGFYKDCVIADLKQTARSPQDRVQMMEMLKRFESSDMIEGAGLEDLSLEARLADLDIESEGEKIWEKLTPEERKEFQQMIKTGAVGHILDSYTPWWETVSLVTPVQPTSSDATTLPPIPCDLPPLASIKSGPVSPCVCYSVINVLFAYAYTLRFFNGGHRELPLQACQMIMDLSLCLSANASFPGLRDAVQSALTTVQQNRDVFNSLGFSLSIFKDVSCILCNVKSHDCHVTRALADVHALMEVAYKDIKSHKSDQKAAAKDLRLARKKIYFFMIWSKENIDLLSTTKIMLDLEIEITQREAVGQSTAVGSLRGNEHGPSLCQERSADQQLIEELS